ncbi:hypothetical protein [Rhizobium sp. SSA_523]|uniref:hypothetical protein n=1 Tax=Rhizobium sp. SSA_523 TaxID=2952477 RepID=UPI002091A758|nr:hypothetical protein [Rhizobium sp. SSA_523]MCO5730557.1 hypothetical protein [Rhizobium sp. SSA_523]WKC25594.1 hypothetical protein QTJ18_16690 [Rhizobium sp. SSA_523]
MIFNPWQPTNYKLLMQRRGESLSLSTLSDDQLRVEFERGRDDLSVLEAINTELNKRDTDDAFELQLDVVGVLAKLRKTAKPPSTAAKPALMPYRRPRRAVQRRAGRSRSGVLAR